MFIREYLFSWRHLEIDSALLLRLLALSALIIQSFSVRQRSHRLEILLQTLAEEMIDQLILQLLLLSSSFQKSFASSVRLAYFLSRNDSLCCVYRCLNVPSVIPMLFFPVSSLSVVTLALQITLVMRQLLFSGHWSFQRVNCAHAQERVVDMMWRMALARLVDSCKLFFDFRLLSAFDSFWRVINKRNGDLCC